jgi:carboxypeptidase D
MNVPLKGVAIGNGWIDPRRQYSTYIDFVVKVGLLEENSDAWKEARKHTDTCIASMNKDKSKELMQFDGCESMVMEVVQSKRHKLGFSLSTPSLPLIDTFPETKRLARTCV